MEPITATPILLRELSVASLGGHGAAMEPAMKLALDASFGSVERWRDEFRAMGKALGGGSGWVLLSFQPNQGTLVSQRADDPTHAPAAGLPILAAAGADVEAFIANVDWSAVYRRYQAAVHAASDAFAVDAEDLAGATLLDVRREGVFVQATQAIAGARWCNPASVADWAGELPASGPVVVYCVYGHEVGRATALRLRAAGVDARFLRGGIDGWKAAGRPLVDKTGPAS